MFPIDKGFNLPAFLRPTTLRVLLLCGVLLILFCGRWVPHQGLPAVSGDSGIFLYIGQQMNQGLHPYTELFDHKPPLIFYVNSAALALSGGDPRGVIGVAWMATLAFCWGIWSLLRHRAGPCGALFAMLAAICLLPELVLLPNQVELYSLPIQALSFYLMAREFEAEPSVRGALMQGLLAAVLFEFRPNHVAVQGLYAAACAYHFLRARRWMPFVMRMAALAVAFVAGNLVILSPILLQGHFRDYWNAAIGFNVEYSGQSGFMRHFYAMGVGILKTARFGGSLFAGTMLACIWAARPQWDRPADRFAVLCSGLMIFESGAAMLSGMAYEHYFQTWILPIALLTGLLVSRVMEGSRTVSGAAACAGACLFLTIAAGFDGVREIAQTRSKFEDNAQDAVRYVKERSRSTSRVFIWGDYGELAFRLGLKPATPFFSTVVFSHDVSTYQRVADQALRTVATARPEFILVRSAGRSANLPDLFPAGPAEGTWDTQEIFALKGRLERMYSRTFTGRSGVEVYELRPSVGSPD